MICKKCGAEVPEDAEFCPVCGEKVDYNEKEEVPGCFNVFAKLGNVFGIISLAGCWLCLGVILGVPGIVFSALGMKSPEHQGKAKTGLILSIIGLIISIVFYAIFAAVIGEILKQIANNIETM